MDFRVLRHYRYEGDMDKKEECLKYILYIKYM